MRIPLNLGQYYTDNIFASLLVSMFDDTINPLSIIEIGVGSGSILNAAYQRWSNAKFYVVDVDPENVCNIRRDYSSDAVRVFLDDVLSADFFTKAIIPCDIDIALCNPPYFRFSKKREIQELFSVAGLGNIDSYSTITSDLIFLAHNIRFLKHGGTLGIILPDTLFTGSSFIYLRDNLLNNHCIKCIIELPDNIFKKTEAKTHILFLKKSMPTPAVVPLFKANRDGCLLEPKFIYKDNLRSRMDYSYYEWLEHHCDKKDNISHSLLDSLKIDISRGRKSKKELERSNLPFFHINSFPNKLGDKVAFEHLSILTDEHDIIAQDGDLLLARVGKRSIGKITIIESGQRIISDCVFRLRGEADIINKLFRFFISTTGQAWIHAHSRGVCSKFISKSDLLNLYLPPSFF